MSVDKPGFENKPSGPNPSNQDIIDMYNVISENGAKLCRIGRVSLELRVAGFNAKNSSIKGRVNGLISSGRFTLNPRNEETIISYNP